MVELRRRVSTVVAALMGPVLVVGLIGLASSGPAQAQAQTPAQVPAGQAPAALGQPSAGAPRVVLPQVTSSGDRVRPVTIDNGSGTGRVRFDTRGNAIDAHDGEIVSFGGRYYLYGTAYGCGYYRFSRPASPFCGFRVYESVDLVTWVDRGPLFDHSTGPWQARCNSLTLSCYRPHVIRHPSTGKYVLWINAYDVPNGYHVLLGDSPTGPFREVALPTLVHKNGGDFGLFIDDDGAGYIAYTTRPGYGIAIERLDTAMQSGTADVVKLGLSGVEAPSLFRRGDIYYLTIADPGCAYCSGTGTSYLTAPTPMGPWSGRTKIAEKSCGGQPAAVAVINREAGPVYLYQSDRWNHRSPNQSLARHYWEPLRFTAEGAIAPLTCAATHTVKIPVATSAATSTPPARTGLQAMNWVCDVRSGHSRAQTFKVASTRKVRELSVVTFRRGKPSKRLSIGIYRTKKGKPAGKALWRTTRSASSLSWSPEQVVVKPGLKVKRGTYAVVLSSTAKGNSKKCYGAVRSGYSVVPSSAALERGTSKWKKVAGDHGVWVRLA